MKKITKINQLQKGIILFGGDRLYEFLGRKSKASKYYLCKDFGHPDDVVSIPASCLNSFEIFEGCKEDLVKLMSHVIREYSRIRRNNLEAGYRTGLNVGYCYAVKHPGLLPDLAMSTGEFYDELHPECIYGPKPNP